MRLAVHFHFAVEVNGRNILTDQSWGRLRHQVARRDDHTCFYCGVEDPDGHVDHLMPLSRGGTDDPTNLVWACVHCNESKGDRTAEEFVFQPAGKSDVAPPERSRSVLFQPGYARAIVAGDTKFAEKPSAEYGYTPMMYRLLRNRLRDLGLVKCWGKQGSKFTEDGLDFLRLVSVGEVPPVLMEREAADPPGGE